MTASKDDKWLAIISGKNLVMNKQSHHQLFIFKRVKGSIGEPDKFSQKHKILVTQIPFFKNVCMEFFFKSNKDGEEPDSLFFAKRECLFLLNFKT